MANTESDLTVPPALQKAGCWVWRIGRLVCAGLVLWLVGFLVFIYALIPMTMADPHVKTDGIVVWTGDACRVTRGFEVFAAARAPRFLISGVSKTHVKEMLVKQLCETHLTPEVLRELLAGTDMGKKASSTVGNGRETATWAAENKLQSIRLVTSAMHMPRARVVFRYFLPDITLIMHPVVVERDHPHHWYRNNALALKLAREYTKYLLAWIQCRL